MEIKEFITALGFDPEKIKTIDDFKANVDSTFTRTALINEDSEPVKKILGQVYSTLSTELKKVAKAKELEVDLDAPELKDKKVKDKLSFVLNAFEDKNKTIISELQEKAGQGNDEKVKEWEKKYDKTSQKVKDLQALLETTKSEYQSFQEKAASQIKNKALDVHKKELFGKSKWANGTNEYTKKGFMDEFLSEYKLDLDENENPVVLNAKGERIQSKKVVGTFMTPYEVWEEKQVKAGLFPINQSADKTKPNTLNFGQPNNNQQQSKPLRTVAPRLR